MIESKQSLIEPGESGGEFYAWDKTWKEIDWADLINKPSSFTPAPHGHEWGRNNRTSLLHLLLQNMD